MYNTYIFRHTHTGVAFAYLDQVTDSGRRSGGVHGEGEEGGPEERIMFECAVARGEGGGGAGGE